MEHYRQLPWLDSNKVLGLINIILPHTLLPSKSYASKTFTLWLRFDCQGSTNPLRRNFLGSEGSTWAPFGRSDSCPNRYARHLLTMSFAITSVPTRWEDSQPTARTTHLLKWGQPWCWSGKGWLTISGKKGIHCIYACVHAHTGTPHASGCVTNLTYAPAINVMNSPFMF